MFWLKMRGFEAINRQLAGLKHPKHVTRLQASYDKVDRVGGRLLQLYCIDSQCPLHATEHNITYRTK